MLAMCFALFLVAMVLLVGTLYIRLQRCGWMQDEECHGSVRLEDCGIKEVEKGLVVFLDHSKEIKS